MEISKILTADILDIIFEGKNKDYGAYELRKSYNRRLSRSVGVMLGTVFLLVVGFMIWANSKMIASNMVLIPDDVTLVDVDPPKEEIVIPPKPPIAEEPPVKERKNVPILIVRDELVANDEPIPLNEELEDAKISLVNKDGAAFTDVVAPPVKDAVNKGIIDVPKKANPDSVFITVQIESRYPGGSPAWQRFLIKNLSNNYPQDAAEKGIQGKVVVKFIVDKSGKVSEVRAISGPAELYETAINVIRKSGKWEPAIQNGQVVNSYKSQPIIFTLADE